jgi:hypothetical protein
MGQKQVRRAMRPVELPAEMLERVFRLLPPRDLKAVVLVCRWWREVGEKPGLWAWVRLTVDRGNITSMPRVLGYHRMQFLRKLVLNQVDVSEELLEAMAATKPEELSMYHANICNARIMSCQHGYCHAMPCHAMPCHAMAIP